MMGVRLLLSMSIFAAYVDSFSPVVGRFFRSHNSLAMVVVTRDINMPALSSTMTEGKIVAWNKKVGEKVTAGDVLLVVESDKADMDVEAYEDGFLAAIFTPEGESAAVGAAVAILVDNLADIGNVGSAPAVVVASAAPVAQAIDVSEPAKAAVATPTVQFEQVTMPALSSTMTEGKVVSWSKNVGDKISSGDMVLIVESDKADMDVESYEEGFLAAILVADGETAPVGSPVGLMAKTVGDIPAVQAYAASLKAGGVAIVAAPLQAVEMSVSVTSVVPLVVQIPKPLLTEGRVGASGYAKALAKEQNIDLRTVTSSRSDGLITSRDLSSGSKASNVVSIYVPAAGTINASPMARKLAAENNISLDKIKGTGNFGRVMPDDVLIALGKKAAPVIPAPTSVAVAATSAAASATPAASIAAAVSVGGGGSKSASVVLDGVVPMNGMQKAVAKNMEKTLDTPIFRVSREIVTDKFDDMYALLKPKGVTVSAMLAKAVAEVLKKHPIINAAYVEGGIKFNKDINVAMAVAIDGGLLTPTIIKAQNQDLFSISRNWKDLVDRAKVKKLTPAESTSGTFTISNLGMFGVSQFDAILPPNTGSILAIAASTPKVVQLPTGHLAVRKSMIVTITCDHRHIYGADAAEFLKDLADLIENNTQSLTMG